MMWNELGISGGTAIVILIALYFVIKWAVKNGIMVLKKHTVLSPERKLMKTSKTKKN